MPHNSELYCEAEVVGVGPGTSMAGGSRSETFDLLPGQVVWIEHMKIKQMGGGTLAKFGAGIEFNAQGEPLLILEQTQIMGILADTRDEWEALRSSAQAKADAPKIQLVH
jgi:hypothetical protein